MRSGIRVDIATVEPHVVNVAYPAAFALSALRPEVRLEIGPLHRGYRKIPYDHTLRSGKLPKFSRHDVPWSPYG